MLRNLIMSIYLFLYTIITNQYVLVDIKYKDLSKDTMMVLRKGFKLKNLSLARFMDYDSLILLNLDRLNSIYTHIRKRSRSKYTTTANSKYFAVRLNSIDNDNSIVVKGINNLSDINMENKPYDITFIMDRNKAIDTLCRWIIDLNKDKKVREINSLYKNSCMNDIGVDLSSESIEMFSNSTEFKVKLNLLQSAVSDIDYNNNLYVLIKEWGCYVIYPIKRLYRLLKEEDEYIIFDKKQLEENIIPPTQFFSYSCA